MEFYLWVSYQSKRGNNYVCKISFAYEKKACEQIQLVKFIVFLFTEINRLFIYYKKCNLHLNPLYIVRKVYMPTKINKKHDLQKGCLGWTFLVLTSAHSLKCWLTLGKSFNALFGVTSQTPSTDTCLPPQQCAGRQFGSSLLNFFPKR